MVEHSTVNRNVVGSSPTRGAFLYLRKNPYLRVNAASRESPLSAGGVFSDWAEFFGIDGEVLFQ